MYIFRSDKPYGPFVDCKRLFGLPDLLDKLGERTYKNLYGKLTSSFITQWRVGFSTNTDAKRFWR